MHRTSGQLFTFATHLWVKAIIGNMSRASAFLLQFEPYTENKSMSLQNVYTLHHYPLNCIFR